jgi:hypothetical protein
VFSPNRSRENRSISSKDAVLVKTFLIIILLGLIAGIALLHHFGVAVAPAAVDGTGRWAVTVDSVKEELATTGRVFRAKAKVVGERLDDARIVALVKAKLMVDRELSALAIGVECHDGGVILRGMTDSPEGVARAVNLAMQTGGVTSVDSQIKVRD